MQTFVLGYCNLQLLQFLHLTEIYSATGRQGQGFGIKRGESFQEKRSKGYMI